MAGPGPRASSVEWRATSSATAGTVAKTSYRSISRKRTTSLSVRHRPTIQMSARSGPAPPPEGFAATSDDYVSWLEGQLEGIQGPIDLVGHDWGGGHVMRLVSARPELVRSWTTDIAGCFDPAYVWHDFAQIWQTPDAGEA